jgi:hypothetical protein
MSEAPRGACLDGLLTLQVACEMVPLRGSRSMIFLTLHPGWLHL